MAKSVLIVERPGQFRDSLLREVSQRGAQAHVRDDAMDALASLERLAPQIVVVSDDPGPPGALGLCRMLQRKLTDAAVYRLGEPSLADQLDERSLLLPRAVGASALAAAIFDRSPESSARVTHRAWEGVVGGLELGPLLLAIETRWLTGRLLITRPGTEREIAFVRGMPIHARGSVLPERLGAVGVRRGVLTDAQVDQALDLAQARGVRIGAALLELGVLDATRLMRLLSAQLLEQLTAACNAGSASARFVLDASVMTRYPLLRVSALTGLLHSVAITPADDVERVLDELAEQPLTPELNRPLERWLTDLQLADGPKLIASVSSVRTLRARLREAELPQPGGKSLSPDVLALTLLRSGAMRMSSESSRQLAEPRAGVRTLSPPSIVSAVTRCARSDFSQWPVSALARARTPLEQAIDESLHGKRSPELARSLALLGPEADCDERFAEVYALLLRADATHPLAAAGGGDARQVTVSDLRLRCHGLLKRLDGLESEQTGGLTRVHLLQTRAQVERTLSVLPAPDTLSLRPAPPSIRATPKPEAAVSSLPATPAAEPSPPPAAPVPASPVALDKPAAVLDPQDSSVLATAEPLFTQGRWRELRQVLTAKNADPGKLSPVLALLYAIALKEDTTVSAEESQKPLAQAETLGMNVVSRVFGLPEQSAAVVLITKRLLRRRPLDWKQKPPARISLLLAFSALLVGALVGFLLHPKLLGLFWK